MTGPIIYNLFPKLAGQMTGWIPHIQRAQAMGFDTIYVNPFHYPGFSGSIYAPKDYYAYDPIILGNDGRPGHEQLREVVQAARGLGMRFMMDLVINHTSIDCPLIAQHPTWFKRKADGTVENPTAIDPADARKVTVWGDLAEVDNAGSADRAGLWDYWTKLVLFYMDMGICDFRCDAAYKVPNELWQKIIRAARKKDRSARFFAETLGCRLEEVQGIAASGFDFLFNSSKWWNFGDPWLLEQYEQFRKSAPSVSFPESHDTKRLAEEQNGNEAVLRWRYAFSAFFSAGVMTVMGYEFGYRKALDVVKTNPFDAEPPHFQMGEWIRSVNDVRRAHAIFNVDAETALVSGKDDPVMILRKTHGKERALLVMNRSPDKPAHLDAHQWPIWMHVPEKASKAGKAKDITPGGSGGSVPLDWKLDLAPAELRVLHCKV
jgi:starch synthase (maltosyl-transferring)